MTLSVHSLSDALGAEVRGVDLRKPVDAAMLGEILESWYEHLLLVFPEQNLTPEQQIAFSRNFGSLEIHPSRHHNLPDHAEILLLTNEVDADGNAISIRDGGSVWHSDLSYMANPSLGSLLYAVTVPKVGGDTEWANMYAAYDSLPDALKTRIADLRAVHQFDQEANPRLAVKAAAMVGSADPGTMWSRKSAAVKARTPDSTHPIVRVHPVTGRKALFINRRFTIAVAGMDADAGEELLLDLFAYAERPEHVYRHRWRKGEALLWDNRCTVHLACGGFELPDLRRMHRTTIAGDATV